MWSLDLKSGHCISTTGVIAYVDPTPTRSGAIRCLGPYAPDELKKSKVHSEMAVLTNKLELITNSYLIWGSHVSKIKYKEHAISLSGVECGFLPLLNLRSQIMIDYLPSELHREWAVDNAGLVHRAGLVLDNSHQPVRVSELDSSAFSPEILETTKALFGKLAPRLFQHFNISWKRRQDIEAKLGTPSWTPIRIDRNQ